MTRSKVITKLFPILLSVVSLGVSTFSAAEIDSSQSNLDNYLICSKGISLEHDFDITGGSYTFPNGLVAEKLEDSDYIVLYSPENSDIPTTYIDSYEYLGNNLYLVFQDVDGFTASGILSLNGDWIYSTRNSLDAFNEQTQVKPLIFDKSTQTTYFTTFEKGKKGIVTTDKEKDAAITMLSVLLADCMDNKDFQFEDLFTELLDNGFMIYAVKNNKIGIASIDTNNIISVKKYYDSIEPIYTYDVSLAQIKTKDPLKIFTEVEDVLYKVEENGKYGLMDRDYDIRIPIKYDDLTKFDDFIAVTMNDKQGLLTTHGEPYIDIDYQYMTPIYYKGDIINSENYVYDSAFFYISLSKDDNMTLVDYFGDEFLNLGDASMVSDGINVIDGVLSLVELDGTLSFSQNTKDGEKYGIIDLENKKILLEPFYEIIFKEMPSSTYFTFLDKKMVLVNKYGKILNDTLTNIYSLEGLSLTQQILLKSRNDKQGVMDVDGRIIIPAIYDSIEPHTFNNDDGDEELGYIATLNQEDKFFDTNGVIK